jgi:hypothetical protein
VFNDPISDKPCSYEREGGCGSGGGGGGDGGL